jgi:hypothetical protein
MKVFRVWFEPKVGEICCVLVSSNSYDKAVELAKEKVNDFPSLLDGNISCQEFVLDGEHASIC